MTRVLSGKIDIYGVDDEVTANETISRPLPVTDVYLDLDQPNVNLDGYQVKWGGECRVEINVDASLLAGDQILIKGRAKLFEGASENTDDLEDEQDIKFFVPKTTKSQPKPTVHEVKLVSEGVGGGDYATIKFVLTNRIVEE